MKFCVFFIFTFLSFNAFAFKLTPMSLTINPVDGDKAGVVYLENDSTLPIAVQITLAKRIMAKDGTETYPEETEDLQAYPTQLIIPPFEKKSIKVTFTGKEVGSVERAYRVIAEQLPLEVEKVKGKKTNVKILLRYIAALYIDNGKTQSDIVPGKIVINKNDISLSVKNNGSKHQVLTNLQLILKKKNSKDVVINSNELKNFTGENILPQSERVFTIPMNANLKKISSDYIAELKFEKDN